MSVRTQNLALERSTLSSMLHFLFCLLGMIMAISLLYKIPITHATPVVGFNAGRILDDSVMVKTDTMDTSQIQNFLNSKVASCDTNGSQLASEYGSSLTHAQYAASHGWSSPPYTCLKDYTENSLTSAQIIYNTSKQFQINPQILIVLLQKEQGLVTDSWPLATQYRTATGYGCPDTAGCDPTFYGFTSQLTEAATMYHAIMNNSPTWFTPYLVGNNTIQYNPVVSCGNTIVNILNRATQALYNYTPYQPDQASLNAGLGTGDGCSSYGNRNFYLYFTSWFGSTYGSDYQWELGTQGVFLDSAMTKLANIDDLAANTTYYFKIQAINLGSKTWTNGGANPILLGTSSPNNRISPLCNTAWVNCERPALLQENSVPTWGTGTFIFSATTPATYGVYNEHFNIVAEGLSWTNDIGMYLPLNVKPPTPAWRPLSQQVYSDSAHTTPINVSALTPSTTYYTVVKALNTGNTIWTNSGTNPVRLGTSSPQDRTSQFYDPSWISQNRAAQLQETNVAPGDTGTFIFTIKAPPSYGVYKEYFRPVVEGIAWMNEIGFQWEFNVIPPTPLWGFVSQRIYTDSSVTTAYDTTKTANGSRAYLVVKALNTGNTIWTNSGTNPVRLGTSSPQDRTSQFYDPSWISQNRAAQLQETNVAPGQIGTFSLWVQAPYLLNGTILKEYFRPVVDGQEWMNDLGMEQPFTFTSPLTSWQYIGQGAYSDKALTIPANLTTATLNTKYYLTLSIKNTSGAAWFNNGTNPLSLGTSSPLNRISNFYDTSWFTSNRPTKINESSVAPGQTGTFTFTISTPSSATTSREYFTPLLEGQNWLTDLGLNWYIQAQ